MQPFDSRVLLTRIEEGRGGQLACVFDQREAVKQVKQAYEMNKAYFDTLHLNIPESGGPNPAQQDAETDGVKYPENVPADESYLDYRPSYASNEVTINWNVTLFALTAGLDALAQK